MQVLKFCDRVKDSSATQCGYREEQIRDDILTFEKAGRQRSGPAKNDIEAVIKWSKKTDPLKKKKAKKPLVIISDDEDCFAHDEDFFELPEFHKTAASEVTSSAQSLDNTKNDCKEPFLQSKIACGSVASNCTDLIKEPSISSNLCETTPKTSSLSSAKSWKDSPYSISSSVTALRLTPEHEAASDKACDKPKKVSKSQCDLLIANSVDLTRVNSISFDLQDVSECSPSKNRPKPFCFKLFDSEEENDLNFENSVSHSEIEKSLSIVDNMENEVTLLSRADATVSAEKCAGFLSSQTKSIPTKSIKNAKEFPDSGTPTSVLPKDQLNKIEVKRAFCAPPNTSKTTSFDASADMFAPQFDLNFDLGFDDFVVNDSGHTSSEHNASPRLNEHLTALSSRFRNTKIFSNVTANLNSDESDSGSEEPPKFPVLMPPTALSPLSKNSFSLSQSIRIENQRLFSELNVPVNISPPCAKVKPQIQPAQPVTEESCVMINNSPIADQKQSTNSEKRQSLKRSLHLQGVTNDDDDFVFDENSLKKKRKSSPAKSKIFYV